MQSFCFFENQQLETCLHYKFNVHLFRNPQSLQSLGIKIRGVHVVRHYFCCAFVPCLQLVFVSMLLFLDCFFAGPPITPCIVFSGIVLYFENSFFIFGGFLKIC